ncbi:MAG: hypothetical protein M5U12_20380 [Verrucomicrobia bacterium]|nr:hypothetical protein [Verrucomicrobiota bacterium]
MKPITPSLITRRSMIARSATVAAGAASLAAFGPRSAAAQNPSTPSTVKTYTNADFYDSAGQFLVDKAREAYYDMFRRFQYPLSDTLKNGMWILDFGLGDFAQVGMAGIFWLNREDYKYFGHEIYLLPGQMIPEHCHVPTAKGAAKMESWQPRRGMIYTFGEGDPTPEFIDRIPGASGASSSHGAANRWASTRSATSTGSRPSTSWSPAPKAPWSPNTAPSTTWTACVFPIPRRSCRPRISAPRMNPRSARRRRRQEAKWRCPRLQHLLTSAPTSARGYGRQEL